MKEQLKSELLAENKILKETIEKKNADQLHLRREFTRQLNPQGYYIGTMGGGLMRANNTPEPMTWEQIFAAIGRLQSSEEVVSLAKKLENVTDKFGQLLHNLEMDLSQDE